MRLITPLAGGITLLMILACAGGSGKNDEGEVYIDTSFDSGEPGIPELPEAVEGSVSDSVEVPNSEYCADVAAWEDTWVAWEDEVVELVNERRAQGAICGGDEFEPEAVGHARESRLAKDCQHRPCPCESVQSHNRRAAGSNPRRSIRLPSGSRATRHRRESR